MANQTAGFGFRQAPTMGSTPATGGQAEYMVKSGLGVGIFQNNPVSLQSSSGDDGYLQDATADTMDDTLAGGQDWATGTSGITLLEGVFNGIFYINSSTSKPTFANHVLASTTFGTDFNTRSTDGIGFVNDNPMQEYTCKADAAVTQANLLSTFNPTEGELFVLQVMVNRLLNWMLLEQRLLQCLELLEQQTIPETMTILQQIRT